MPHMLSDSAVKAAVTPPHRFPILDCHGRETTAVDVVAENVTQ